LNPCFGFYFLVKYFPFVEAILNFSLGTGDIFRRLSPIGYFPIHHSQIILLFDATWRRQFKSRR